VDRALETWERRLKGEGGVERLLQPALIAALLLDPLYADNSSNAVNVPHVSHEHETSAKQLIERLRGREAANQFADLLLLGWSGELFDPAQRCSRSKRPNPAGASTAARVEVASVAMRKGVE
jgi:hypothetical protein